MHFLQMALRTHFEVTRSPTRHPLPGIRIQANTALLLTFCSTKSIDGQGHVTWIHTCLLKRLQLVPDEQWKPLPEYNPVGPGWSRAPVVNPPQCSTIDKIGTFYNPTNKTTPYNYYMMLRSNIPYELCNHL